MGPKGTVIPDSGGTHFFTGILLPMLAETNIELQWGPVAFTLEDPILRAPSGPFSILHHVSSCSLRWFEEAKLDQFHLTTMIQLVIPGATFVMMFSSDNNLLG